jgi:hypothetical protein
MLRVGLLIVDEYAKPGIVLPTPRGQLFAGEVLTVLLHAVSVTQAAGIAQPATQKIRHCLSLGLLV